MTDQSWNISVCGLNCGVCEIHLGTGDHERSECGACRGPLEQHWSPDCEFVPCAREKGVDYCFQCGEFVCEKLKSFAEDPWPHHRRTVENMKRMKEMGLEAWIEDQKKKGQCLFCP